MISMSGALHEAAVERQRPAEPLAGNLAFCVDQFAADHAMWLRDHPGPAPEAQEQPLV